MEADQSSDLLRFRRQLSLDKFGNAQACEIECAVQFRKEKVAIRELAVSPSLLRSVRSRCKRSDSL